jgi:hypothetical protein
MYILSGSSVETSCLWRGRGSLDSLIPRNLAFQPVNVNVKAMATCVFHDGYSVVLVSMISLSQSQLKVSGLRSGSLRFNHGFESDSD